MSSAELFKLNSFRLALNCRESSEVAHFNSISGRIIRTEKWGAFRWKVILEPVELYGTV